jgi:hypothetical protein
VSAEEKYISCRNCLNDRFDRVPPRWFEVPLALIGYRFYRCIFCHARYRKWYKRKRKAK